MKKRNIAVPIGIAAAVAFFMIFFSGSFSAFPRIFVLDLFQRQAAGTQQAITGQATDPVQQQQVPQQEERLGGLVTFFNLQEGGGAEAVKGSEVAIGYVGVYEGEEGQLVEFDRNTEKETPFTFTLGSGQVIPGFDAGILGMREGGVRVMTIAPEAGYGAQQVGNIPPNTTLQFIVELYEAR